LSSLSSSVSSIIGQSSSQSSSSLVNASTQSSSSSQSSIANTTVVSTTNLTLDNKRVDVQLLNEQNKVNCPKLDYTLETTYSNLKMIQFQAYCNRVLVRTAFYDWDPTITYQFVKYDLLTKSFIDNYPSRIVIENINGKNTVVTYHYVTDNTSGDSNNNSQVIVDPYTILPSTTPLPVTNNSTNNSNNINSINSLNQGNQVNQVNQGNQINTPTNQNLAIQNTNTNSNSNTTTAKVDNPNNQNTNNQSNPNNQKSQPLIRTGGVTTTAIISTLALILIAVIYISNKHKKV
jgi:cellobiose-specific phosphotransferase system component IIB